jgi:HD-like signal output (HDOD) protein
MTMTEPIREQTELSASITELRPLPAAALAILRITEHDRFSAHELATTISSDQAPTSKLLRLANSAYYGFPPTIETVSDAVVPLGFRTVRATTLASCVIDTLHSPTHVNYDELPLRQHPHARGDARSRRGYPPASGVHRQRPAQDRRHGA